MICELCLRYDGGDCGDFYLPVADDSCEAFIPMKLTLTLEIEETLESLESAVISKNPVAVKLINEWVAHMIKKSGHYSRQHSRNKEECENE